MKVVWTTLARQCLKEVQDYIALDSKTHARRTAERIRKAVNRLAKFPEAGWVVEAFDDPRIREIVVGNYRVMYTLLQQEVNILIVHHAARRPPKLGELLPED